MRNSAGLIPLSAALLLLFLPLCRAFAADDTKEARLNIRLEIEAGCTLKFDTSSNQISFGTFIDLRNPRQAAGSFSLSCSRSVNGEAHKAKISLDAGLNPSDKTSERCLYLDGNPGNDKKRMGFQIYLGSSGNTIWGDGAGRTEIYSVSIPATGSVANVPFHAELFAQPLEGFSQGVYSNVLHATVQYD